MSLTIGLTGGIASGKSTVSKMLAGRGIPIVDADIEARLAVQKGEKAYNDIINFFGKDILQEDGELDRAKLGGIIFNDEEKRKVLNSIVHPAVRERMLAKKARAEQEGAKAVVLDIPLLFESRLQFMADKILLVYVNEDTQVRRLMERNDYSRDEAMARIQSQMPLGEKVGLAHEVIDNNGSIAETEQQLNEILARWGI
jgi:dephospho-CoA kinase